MRCSPTFLASPPNGARFPSVDTVAGEQNIVGDVRAAAAAGLAPIVFTTVKSAQIFSEIGASVLLSSICSAATSASWGRCSAEKYFARIESGGVRRSRRRRRCHPPWK